MESRKIGFASQYPLAVCLDILLKFVDKTPAANQAVVCAAPAFSVFQVHS